MDPLLGKAKKIYASRFYQLKVGHGAIGTFLKRIGVAETGECWWCGAAENTGVGNREGATEREVEWQQRRDQEGEDQLGDI